MNGWLFEDPPNVAVLTTCHILEGRSILYVSRDKEDGAWQFHTGEVISGSDAKVVSLRRIVELDPSVLELADLRLGWVATRSKTGKAWQRFKHNGEF